MELITMQSEVYYELVKKLDEIAARLVPEKQETKKQLLDNEEFLQLLKISRRTAQNYRDAGLIAFAQIGSKIYYRQRDIEEFIEKHHNKAFK